MKIIRSIIVLLITAGIVGCSDSGSPVHYILPDDFHGEVKLIADSSKPEIPKVDGHYEILIPLSGEVRFRDLRPLGEWHSQVITRVSGKVVPLPDHTDPDEPSWHGGTSSSEGYTTFFVGTYREYRAHQGLD